VRNRGEAVAKSACKPPARDRVHLVESLLRSLEPEADIEVDAAWVAEIARRTAEIDPGRAPLLTWGLVKRCASRRGARGRTRAGRRKSGTG